MGPPLDLFVGAENHRSSLSVRDGYADEGADRVQMSSWKRAVSFLLLILISSLPLRQVEADYGESSTSLGQFTDEFEDLDHVSVRVKIERNATLNAMELNYTEVEVPEDFTTYTEVDENGDVTVTALKVDWETLRRDAITYVWKDFNPNYFGDFEIELELNMTDFNAGDASSVSVVGIAFSNTTGVIEDLRFGDVLYIMIQQETTLSNKYNLFIRQYVGGVARFLIGNRLNLHNINVEYYVVFNRTGTTVWLKVYSDVAHLNLLYSYEVNNADTDVYRYFMISNFGVGLDGADDCTGYIENVKTGSFDWGYVSEGYFTTTDYLEEANGSILVQLTNTTIPDGTVITVEFSEDNAAWVLNDWAPLFGGFESIDLRDLNYSGGCWIRYNFSTTNPEITPRLYQSRLITTEGAEGEGAGDIIVESDFPWVAIAIILSLISYLLLSIRK